MPGNYGNVNWYFWIPIVAPIAGGIIGALAYDFFINHVLRARGAVPQMDMVEVGAVAEGVPAGTVTETRGETVVEVPPGERT
jgi:glycerol uptake facilitator protein